MTQPALIGIIPKRELWPIIKKEKWYHIPKESAPDNIFSNQYLAFYFPECFPKQEQYQIKYYAKVSKIDIKKRINLFPAEPKHRNAQKDYYQIHLAEIKKLPNHQG